MSKLLDTNNGNFYVGEHFVLHANLLFQKLVATGMVFSHEFNMKTGWVFRTTGPHLVCGQEANLSLGFINDELRRINFSFVQIKGMELKELLKAHNQFLLQELGRPNFECSDGVSYQFAWGAVESSIDPRGGSCDIVISWN
jgi:hypothetical protein